MCRASSSTCRFASSSIKPYRSCRRPINSPRFPSIQWSRSSSVNLHHRYLTLPRSCFQLPMNLVPVHGCTLQADPTDEACLNIAPKRRGRRNISLRASIHSLIPVRPMQAAIKSGIKGVSGASRLIHHLPYSSQANRSFLRLMRLDAP